MKLLADLLTFLRIVLAAVLVSFVFSSSDPVRFMALPVFLLASLTDYWDGRLARRAGGGSAFGAFMDPVADKVLTLSAFFSFWAIGLLPLWAVCVIAARDIAVTLMRLRRAKKGHAVNALPGGKQKTVFQMIYISLVLLVIALRQTHVWSAAFERIAQAATHLGIYAIILMTLVSGFEAWRHRHPKGATKGS